MQSLKSATTRTGPSDDNRCFRGTDGIDDIGDDENGSKRRETRRLGLWYVFFF